MTNAFNVVRDALVAAEDWAECRGDASCDTEDSCRVCVALLTEGHELTCWVLQVKNALDALGE